MPPSRLLLPRTLRLPQTSPIGGSILPCASATTSASLARSLLFLLRGLVKAAFGHLAPISRPWPPELVVIYAWTGEKDLALEQLNKVSKLPYAPSYGDLRLSPEWDPLRGDPRFEKIVASLAPKQ